jgi:hypothetical protein
MITVIHIDLNKGDKTLHILHFGTVRLQSPVQTAQGELLPVRILSEHGETTIHNFAQAIIGEDPKQTTKSAIFDCAYASNENYFLALIGLLEVVFINERLELYARKKLHRNIEDDWGSFHMSVIPCEGGFVTLYEAAVAYFKADGSIKWQRLLSPHDYVLSYDSSTLQLRSDIYSDLGSGDWTIDLETGSCSKK